MSSSQVLIISEHVDAHISFVTKHLNIPHVIYDPAIHSLDISFSGPDPSVAIGGQELSNIRSVWMRKPSIANDLSSKVAPHYYDYCRSALEAHIQSLYTLLENKFWVSSYHAILKASHKPAQIGAAHKVGFNVPDSIFTSNPDAAKKFIQSHKKVVTKTLSSTPARNKEGVPLLFLAKDISGQPNINLSGLSVAPAIFQAAIDSILDIRVTVIGDKVFAATIQPRQGYKKPKDIKDWHKYENIHTGGKATQITPYNLPTDISDKCIAHARHFNLKFSAIDLILDQKGKYWFLENNPNGQWAYIEEATGQPMGEAMAQLLTRS